MTDRETGSTWLKATGEAVGGSLKGKRLEKVRFFASFWFAWSDFYRETLVWEPLAGSVIPAPSPASSG